MLGLIQLHEQTSGLMPPQDFSKEDCSHFSRVRPRLCLSHVYRQRYDVDPYIFLFVHNCSWSQAKLTI